MTSFIFKLTILKHKLKDIEDYFYIGLCRYNWLSISIDIFTNGGLILINKTKNQFNNLKIVSAGINIQLKYHLIIYCFILIRWKLIYLS